MLNLGPIGLLSPWLLLGLLSLPVIWWLLRITPPSPRQVQFPPVRILRSLYTEEETPATTPLWLTILRMLLAVLIVAGLAHPVLNPQGEEDASGPLLLVVDDSWAAADGWSQREDVLDGLLTQAERAGQPVAILTTSPRLDGEPMRMSRLMPAAEARRIVAVVRPNGWKTDRGGAVQALRSTSFDTAPAVHWLSDGIDEGDASEFAQALADIGSVTVYREETAPAAVLPPEATASGLEVRVLRPEGGPSEARWLRVSAADGQVLARSQVEFAQGEAAATSQLTLPIELRNEAVSVGLEGYRSAAGVALLDDRWRRRPVGLVSGVDSEKRAQPLLSPEHYLERAIDPFADLRKGTIETLLERPLAVMILADIGRLTESQQSALGNWVDNGGVLLRFAGARVAQGGDDLVPVPLRAGRRALGGALSWSEPAPLAPFPETSPFRGLPIPDDVFVRRQVLAEPSLDLPALTWARLADGTPLVTGKARGQGWLILIHTTANADWSDLPLSGLFVGMLQRILQLSRGVAEDGVSRPLPPLTSLDGYGQLGTPPPAARPISADRVDETTAGPRSPAGYYGTDTSRRALNLTAGWEGIRAIGALPAGASERSYASGVELDLKPWLLSAAVLLALIDILIALALRGLLTVRTAGQAAAILLASMLLLPVGRGAVAQNGDQFALEATLETRLAYVLTGNSEIDDISRAGLIGLSEVLMQRTSIEPGPPMAVSVERDELVFFPLLYWPIVAAQPTLSDRAIARLSNYMRTGGTILFDTRDADLTVPGISRGVGAGGPESDRLRRILQRLDVPALMPVPQEHVLTKAFYLMQSFPGRFAGGRVWVEDRAGGVNDGVSSVVIGANDWAAAWALDEFGRPVAAVVPGGERQREMAYRFGVNLVMYTLTGNYKADQVHVPAILERLGQ